MGRVSSPPLLGCSAQHWPHEVWEPRGMAATHITALATVLLMLPVSPGWGRLPGRAAWAVHHTGPGAGGGPEFG